MPPGSTGKHDKRSPEDADVKPPRMLGLVLGGSVFLGTIRLSQEGLVGKARSLY
jgi:hypothetical protein